MKSILSLIFFFSTFHAFTQDTLFFPSGEIKVVELISVNQQTGIIYYRIGDKQEIRTIRSLKSFSNHLSIGNESFKSNWFA
jgi:hypothetical protein